MARIVSRIAGLAFVAVSIALTVHTYRLIDVEHQPMTSHLGGVLPSQVRVPGGVAAFALFAVPAMIFGLRLILKPVNWNEPLR